MPPPTTLELPARGRGRLVATATATPEGLSLRLDSHTDETFWAEIDLSYDQLTALLAAAPPSAEQIAAVREEVAAIGRGEFALEVTQRPLPADARRLDPRD